MKTEQAEKVYRVNELSLKPGGKEVTIVYWSGKVATHNWVKFPEKYIDAVLRNSDNWGPEKVSKIDRIMVDGETYWRSTVNRLGSWEGREVKC